MPSEMEDKDAVWRPNITDMNTATRDEEDETQGNPTHAEGATSLSNTISTPPERDTADDAPSGAKRRQTTILRNRARVRQRVLSLEGYLSGGLVEIRTRSE